MKNTFRITVLLIVISTLIIETDGILGMAKVAFDYIFDAIRKGIRYKPSPSNSDDSIQYLLYTPDNMYEPCRIQPSAEQFDECSFSSDYETKFLVHGFVEFLEPKNQFNVLKNSMLEQGNYNVIIVNWTLHNTMPFGNAYRNAKLVGEKMAKMMKFLKRYGKASLKSFHCIGHSLGSHVCGVAGRNARKIGRITALDPDALSIVKEIRPNIRLFYTDAYFVDAIHTSDIFSLSGLGYLDPIGHVNFYPNGGVHQPHCAIGNTFKVFKGKTVKIWSPLDITYCNHFLVLDYFINSVKDDCKFVATKCESYSDFERGECKSDIKVEMGFRTKKMKNVRAMSKFYLNTLDSPPFC